MLYFAAKIRIIFQNTSILLKIMFKNTKLIIKIVFEYTNCIILYGDLAKSRFFCFFAMSNNYRFAMNHDIFISYSSKQKSIADGVCHYLEENGFKCWMAPRDIPVGANMVI